MPESMFTAISTYAKMALDPNGGSISATGRLWPPLPEPPDDDPWGNRIAETVIKGLVSGTVAEAVSWVLGRFEMDYSRSLTLGVPPHLSQIQTPD